MTATILYLTRHGKSESNKAELLGKKDSPLSLEGLLQARKLAQNLKKEIDTKRNCIVYSSDFKRAFETARAFHPLPHRVIADLGERSFGLLENDPGQKNLKKYKKHLDSFDQESRANLSFAQGMETDKEAFQRLNSSLQKIASENSEGSFVVITHSNVMRIFLVYIKWATFKQLPPGSIENTGYVKIQWQKGKFKVLETKGIHRI